MTKSASPTSTPNTVSIRPGVSVLSVLRHLNYKPWFALAEFVDNSLQSFLSERPRLQALHGKAVHLRVDIDVESGEAARISIRDNAAGIAIKDFPRAFRPAAIPPDRSGLSEFGMGMKSAACWFSPRWAVRTKALGEGLERTVRFDINQIVHDQIEELRIGEEPTKKINDHFTEIVLEDLYHVPVGRTVGKIKEHLTDIYRTFIREGVLELRIGGERLAYAEPNLLRMPYVREPGGPVREWKKDINFPLGGGMSVTGFAALRDPGNFARSGFALFRRGRLIEGSGEEGYRPSYIFGQPGSFRSLRLFGELHLEGFQVSHTKDGFRWDENEQPFLELLKEHLDSDDLPLLKQADHLRVHASRNEMLGAAKQAVDNTAAAMESSLPQVLPAVAVQPPVETRSTSLGDTPTLAARDIRVQFRGQSWLIRVQLTNEASESQWLAMSDQAGSSKSPETLEIRVSLAHPFMVSFAQTDPNDVEALLRVAAAIALSEKLARLAGVKSAGTVRRNINEILREALSKP